MCDKALHGAVAVMMCPEKHLHLPRGWVSPGELCHQDGKPLLLVRWMLECRVLWILGHQESRPFIKSTFNGELGKREKIGKLFLSPVGAWGGGGGGVKISLGVVMGCQCFSACATEVKKQYRCLHKNKKQRD